jgi:uncharacterized membrane protein
MFQTPDESAAEMIRRARRSIWTVRVVMLLFAVWVVLVLFWLIPVAILNTACREDSCTA